MAGLREEGFAVRVKGVGQDATATQLSISWTHTDPSYTSSTAREDGGGTLARGAVGSSCSAAAPAILRTHSHFSSEYGKIPTS